MGYKCAIEIDINDDKSFTVTINDDYIDGVEDEDDDDSGCCCISNDSDGLTFSAMNSEELLKLLSVWVNKIKPDTSDRYNEVYAKAFNEMTK